MVTFYIGKIIATCWAIIGHILFDIIFKETSDEVSGSIDQSKNSVKKIMKPFWATLNVYLNV